MTDLRTALIEAGARAMYDADDAYPEKWEYQTEDVKDWYRRMSRIHVDSSLDTLADRADEWEMEVDDKYWNAMTSGDFDRIEEFVTRRLIAVLRGDTGVVSESDTTKGDT